MQNIFKPNLNKITRRRFKSKDKRCIKNIKLLHDSLQSVIKLFNCYSTVVSEAKSKVKNGEGFKILTPKQMLPRLPLAFAQVKAGNTSENLLNEIRQTIFCIELKKLLKVFNNIMNSRKL